MSAPSDASRIESDRFLTLNTQCLTLYLVILRASRAAASGVPLQPPYRADGGASAFYGLAHLYYEHLVYVYTGNVLLQVVERAAPHRLHRVRHITIRRQHDHLGKDIVSSGGAQHEQAAVGLFHRHIRYDDVERQAVRF